MIEALILIGIALLICLLATPFLIIIFLLHKWVKWVQGMVNGHETSDTPPEVITRLKKLLSK